MSIEGVLLSYTTVGNFSDNFSSKSTCISASGIKFREKWILTHGMFLGPMKSIEKIVRSSKQSSYDDLPDIYVTSGEDANFTVSVGRVCYIWKCPILEKVVDRLMSSWTIGTTESNMDTLDESGKTLFPIFALIEIPGSNEMCPDLNYKEALMELFKLITPHTISRGERAYIYSTPFGNEVFLNCRTEGVICNSVGEYNELLLCDASSVMCSEGAPVYSLHNNLLFGIVLSSLSWWRGEWVGLTLVGALRPTLQSILFPNSPINIIAHSKSFPVASIIDLIDLSVVLVRCGETWGSGLILKNNFILTCSHVIPNKRDRISIFTNGESHNAELVFQSATDVAYDLALLKCNTLKADPESILIFAEDPPVKGENVVAVGFPFFNERSSKNIKPSITRGTITKILPYMIQTSCCIQSGFSGGCFLRIKRVDQSLVCEVLGTIVCNVKNDEKNICYPHMNMAIPVSVFKHPLEKFMKSKDPKVLKEFENPSTDVQSLWKFQPYQNKL